MGVASGYSHSITSGDYNRSLINSKVVIVDIKYPAKFQPY